MSSNSRKKDHEHRRMYNSMNYEIFELASNAKILDAFNRIVTEIRMV